MLRVGIMMHNTMPPLEAETRKVSALETAQFFQDRKNRADFKVMKL
jgi:hypothetical protein